jgi:uncharacterized membrane protein YhhN
MSAPEPMPAGRTDNENQGDDEGGGASGNGDAERHAGSMESAASQAKRLLVMAGGAGLAYGVSLRDAPYPDQAAAKVLMCALLFLACARHEPMRERLGLMAALAASGVGDALLALPQLTLSFVGGLGAFLVAHLAYCTVLFPRAVRAGSGGSGRSGGLWRGIEAWRRAAVGSLWVAALAMYVVFLPHLDALAVPVAVYMLALCAMASFSLMARPACLALSLGGLAFVASDTMLGIDRFLSPFSGSGYAIWLSYAIAQVSIAAGILLSDDARPQERGA